MFVEQVLINVRTKISRPTFFLSDKETTGQKAAMNYPPQTEMTPTPDPGNRDRNGSQKG